MSVCWAHGSAAKTAESVWEASLWDPLNPIIIDMDDWACTLALPGKYDWMICTQRRYGLVKFMSCCRSSDRSDRPMPLANAEKNWKFSAFRSLLYCPKLRRYSRRICFEWKSKWFGLKLWSQPQGPYRQWNLKPPLYERRKMAAGK